MLKIKFNINEFTIVFFFPEKIGRKKNAQKISFSLPVQRLPSFLFSLCSVQRLPFLLFFLFQCFFFFLVSFSTPPLFLFNASFYFFSSCLSFLFSSRVALFFSPKTFFFSPKQFSLQPKRVALLSSALLFFSGQRLLLFFFLFFPYIFKGQPKTYCSPKSPLNLSNSCVPLCQDEVKPLASKPRRARFSCQFSSQKKNIFLQPPFIQNPIFSLAALSLLFE